MNPMFARIVAAMGAGALGQVISIVIQVASLPLYLLHWDANRYGTWLMLSAVPAYLLMADVGMVATAGNRMTMEMARGRPDHANRIFHSATVFMLTVCGVAGALATVILLSGWTPLPVDQTLALWLLMLSVLAALFTGLSEAAFKATGRYAFGTSLGHLIRLAEWLGGLIGLLLVGSFPAVALGGLVARLGGLALIMSWATRQQTGLSWGAAQARRSDVLDMVRPAMSFMVFPLSNALTFQGATLLVGHVFGPALVTVFNAHRTLARVAVQVTSVFSNAIWAEFSRLYGTGHRDALASLYGRSLRSGIVVCTGFSAVLYLVAPWLIQIWTHGRISIQPALLACLLVYAAVAGIWNVPRVLLMACNQHMGLAPWFLALSSAMLVLAYGLAHAVGLSGVALAMLVAEGVIAAICLQQASELMRNPAWQEASHA